MVGGGSGQLLDILALADFHFLDAVDERDFEMNARIDLADGLAEAFHNADMAFLNGVDGEPGDEQDEQPGSAGPAGREEVLVAGRERAGVGDAGGGCCCHGSPLCGVHAALHGLPDDGPGRAGSLAALRVPPVLFSRTAQSCPPGLVAQRPPFSHSSDYTQTYLSPIRQKYKPVFTGRVGDTAGTIAWGGVGEKGMGRVVTIVDMCW